MTEVPRISVTETEEEAGPTLEQFQNWSRDIAPYLERIERSRAMGGIVIAVLALTTFFNLGWAASALVHDLNIGAEFVVWTILVFVAAVLLPHYFFTYVPNQIREEVQRITDDTFGSDSILFGSTADSDSQAPS